MHPLFGHNSLKEENFGQSIWDKSVVLLGTSWEIHWELFYEKKQKKFSQTNWGMILFWAC
jgi:hypothetical protein